MEANLQIIGLIFDAAGIVVFATPALIGMVGQIAAQSGTYGDYNNRAISIVSSSHVDTAVGAPLLLLGFLMQIAGIVGFGIRQEWLSPASPEDEPPDQRSRRLHARRENPCGANWQRPGWHHGHGGASTKFQARWLTRASSPSPARDDEARLFCDGKAILRKATHNDLILRFAEEWRRTGAWPGELSFDSKLTTYAHLARLDELGIRLITLRRRGPKLFADLGYDMPTLLLTNQTHETPTLLVDRYARPMLIKNTIDQAIDLFHMDALCSAVPLRIDVDFQLTVIAATLYRLLADHIRQGHQRRPRDRRAHDQRLVRTPRQQSVPRQARIRRRAMPHPMDRQPRAPLHLRRERQAKCHIIKCLGKAGHD